MSITRLKEKLDVNVDAKAIQSVMNTLSLRVAALETSVIQLKRRQPATFSFETLDGNLYSSAVGYESDGGFIP